MNHIKNDFKVLVVNTVIKLQTLSSRLKKSIRSCKAMEYYDTVDQEGNKGGREREGKEKRKK